jgi:acyl-CoA dehydrogenase
MGLIEACLVLEAQGRVVAAVPIWATTVLGALSLTRFGSSEQQAALLPGVVRGERVLTAALADAAVSPTSRPAVRAVAAGDGYLKLSGVASTVPQAHLASHAIVPVKTPEGLAVVLVDLAGDGVSIERAETTNREIHPHLHFSDYMVHPNELIAAEDRGEQVLKEMLEMASVGLCAIQVGVGDAALAQTAAHLNEREQFGKPLSSFQGTKLRAADASIDLEAIRVTCWHAAWRIDAGKDAAEAVMIAKWQASDRGQRVVHATQHLHGGTGADITYPIHRYYLWGKQIELLLGSPALVLAKLGKAIAENPELVEVR